MERSYKKIKQEKIVERKLGREGAIGQAWKDKGLIEIDPRQTGREYLDTLIHEKLHLMFPEMSESNVTKNAKKLSNFLWECNFRRIYT